MIKVQRECLGEASFYIDICLSNDFDFRGKFNSDIWMQQRINITTFYLPCNLEFNVLFKDVLTRVHSLCNAKDFKA